MDVQEYLSFKRQVETQQREADRAEGAYRQLLLRLQQEFHVQNLEEAEIQLLAWKKELENREVDYQVSLRQFQQEEGQRLA